MKLFLLLSLVLSAFHVHGQRAVVSTINTRTLYVGAENNVDVAIPNMKCSSFFLKSSDCEIKGADCNYKVTPVKTGMINLYIVNKVTSKILDSVKIKVKAFPDPKLKIGDGGDHSIGMQGFFKTGPIPYLPDVDFGIILKVTEFEIKIFRNDDTLYIGKNIGDHYTQESLDAINKMTSGDLFLIENVRITGTKNLEWFLQYNVVTIKIF